MIGKKKPKKRAQSNYGRWIIICGFTFLGGINGRDPHLSHPISSQAFEKA